MSLIPGWGSHAGDEDEVPVRGTVPPELIERLKKVLTDKAPDVTVTVESWGACRFANHCQEYRVHRWTGKSKTAGIHVRSSAELGPTADGFHLELNWSSGLRGGAAGGGWAWRPVYVYDYWLAYSRAYKLKSDPGYIHLNWAYGPQTDMTILDLVCSEVEAFSDPAFDERSDATYGDRAFDERSDGWKKKSAALKTKLADVLEKFQADATWRTDGEVLVCEFKTMEFDVHSVDEKGHVSPEAHKETGPQADGFIVRLVPLKNAYALQPRQVYGLSEGPYWREYFSVVEGSDHAFRIDLRYGVRTDKELLNTVATELDHRVRENWAF